MQAKPNILVFMTDQQLADTLTQNSMVITPNVDRFRQHAVEFTDAYCPSPHCCPSRATFFTGLYPSEHNVWHNVEVNNAISRGVFDDVTMFPQLLQEHDYDTIFSGKWHVSAYEGPLDRGFNRVLREQVSNYGRMNRDNLPHTEDWERYYSDPDLIDGENETKEFGRIIRPGYPRYYQFGIDENPFGDTDTVDLAANAILEHPQDKPFFMFVGTSGPHDPYTPPQRFLDLYKDAEISLPSSFDDPLMDRPALYRRTRDQFQLTRQEHLESVRRYYAFCSYEDWLFGKLLDAVEKRGITKNTMIIYLSDHGDYLGAHGLWAKGLPCFREAYNICAMIGGAGLVSQSRTCGNFVSLADFAPTILAYAGIEPRAKISGMSLMPLIELQQEDAQWRDTMYTQTNGNEIYGIQRAVFNKKWKYVYNGFDYDELYDLAADPQETINLIGNAEHRDVVKHMSRNLWQFAREHSDTCTCPYIMVGLAPYGPGVTVKDI